MTEPTDDLTPRLLRAKIRRLWRRFGLIEGRSGRPGASIPDFIQESRRINRSAKPRDLALWLIIYDEFLSWLVSFYMTSWEGLLRSKKNSTHNEVLKCYVLTVSKVIADLFAIRHLCVEGFDIQARIILRSTIEYIDVFTISSIDAQIAREFNDTQTHQSSHQFWAKYFRSGGGGKKNKARKLINQQWNRVSAYLGITDAGEVDEWLNEMSKNIVMISHPSFVGGFFSDVVLGAQDTERRPGMFGRQADISSYTLYEIVKHCLKFLILSVDIPFRYPATNDPIMKYDETKEHHKHVKLGREFLLHLFIRLSDKGSDISLSLPEIDSSSLFDDGEDIE